LFSTNGERDMTKKPKDWTRVQLKKVYVRKYIPLTIPVNVSIEGKQTILDLSGAEKVLGEAKMVAVQNCGCRTRIRKCEGPLKVCLTLRYDDRKAVKGRSKVISKSEALEILRSSHEAGLVHMTYTVKGKEKPFVICSCCSCCCHSLSALVRFGIPDHVVASEYKASDNDETCNNCGTCVQRCQFHARKLVNDELRFDQTKCFGCGLCVTTCPTESIKLVRR
jgi:Pyruvate/2-oxoacid:ferredoxin oxidoreductase delta subunit